MDGLRRRLPPLSSLLPFEAAARHESFSRAAEELGLTQTASSKQIRALESDLNVSLFERRNRAVFLTGAGRRFGRIVGIAMADIANEAARIRGPERSGELVLYCRLCEAFYWLMPRLSGFHRLHPEIAPARGRCRRALRPGDPNDRAPAGNGRAGICRRRRGVSRL